MAKPLSQALCPLALQVVLCFTAILTVSAVTKPNVLMIAIDDLRPQFGQAYSVPEVKTPNMDKFVETGTVMQHSYVQQAVCGPSRASILTGRRPDTTQSQFPYSWCWSVRGQFTTLPHYFREEGYITAGSGKLFHPDACGQADPHSVGDDRTAWSMPYFPEPECVQWGSVPCPKTAYWNDTMGDSVFVSDLDDDQLTDGQLATHAQALLGNFSKQGVGIGSGQPFFMAVGLHKPHLPHIAPKKYFDMYDLNETSLPPNPDVPKNFPQGAWYPSDEIRTYIDAHKQFMADGFAEVHPISDADIKMHRRAYFAATSYVDAQVGRIMDTLDSSGLSNNTIVVLWSDHGWHLGDTNSWGKCTNFETATRNTLMWRVPGGKNSGKSNRLVEMVDLYPTLLELTGLPQMRSCVGDEGPTSLCLQGESYASEFINGAPVREAKKYAYTQWMYGQIHPGDDSRGPTIERLQDEDVAPYHVQDRKPVVPHNIGYTVRSDAGYRLTEYYPYNHTTFSANWDGGMLAREFYDYNMDPLETVNQVHNSSYTSLINDMHTVMRAQLEKKIGS